MERERMGPVVQWLTRPIAMRRSDGEDGGQAVEYTLIAAAASALVAYGLMPATSDLSASIARALADLLSRLAG